MSERQEDSLDQMIRSVMADAEEEVPGHLWAAISERLDAVGAQSKRRVVIPLWFRWTAVGTAVAAAIVLGVFLFLPGRGETDLSGGLAGVETPVEVGVEASVPVEAGVEASGEASVPVPVEAGVEASGEASVPVSVKASVETAELACVEDSGSGSEEATDAVPDSASEDVPSLASQLASAPDYIAQALDVEDIADESDAPDAEKTVAGDGEGHRAGENETGSTSTGGEISGAQTFTDAWSDPFAREDAAQDAAGGNRRKVRAALTMAGDAMGNVSSSSSSSSSGIRRQLSSSIVKQTTPGISENSDASYSIPASFGLGVKIIFTDRWSLGAGLDYSLLSRTFSGTYTTYSEETDTYSSTDYSKIRQNLSYVGIPVNVYFSIVRSHAVDFYAYAGGTAEKLVGNRYVLENDGLYKDSTKGFQFSVDLGIGVEFLIVDMLGIYIDPSIRYYIPDSRQPVSIRTQEPFNFGFEIGFRIRL